MLGLVFFFHEESAYFAPNVPTLDAVVVQHVWRAVDRDHDGTHRASTASTAEKW